MANGANGLVDDGTGSALASLTAAGNAAEGVLLADAGVARMTASTLADNGGPGLVMPGVAASTSTIGKSTIVGNQMEGILGPGAGAKFVFDSNVIGGNLQDGLKLGPSTAGLIVTKNSLFGNGKNGLIVSPPIDSGLFKSNAAVGNTQVGIDIDVAGSVVTKNVGEENETGIITTAGDVDGGGNVGGQHRVPVRRPVQCGALRPSRHFGFFSALSRVIVAFGVRPGA